MATRSKGGLEFFADFSGVAKAIGSAWGVIDAADNRYYQEDLLKTAFAESNQEFNRDAAAFAASGGNIKHMFEWGTVGINRARTDMRPNPLSERARLWHPMMRGSGLNQELMYTFKPSVAFVPKPKPSETGMDPDVIAALKDHVFWNKAMVMETGMTVTIRPVDAKFLLIPLYKDRTYTAARSSDYQRGYMLQQGPNVFRPGAKTAGTFDRYWTHFWERQGNKILNESVERQINEDFEAVTVESRGAGRMARPVPDIVINAVTKARRNGMRNAARRAKRRADREATLNAER